MSGGAAAGAVAGGLLGGPLGAAAGAALLGGGVHTTNAVLEMEDEPPPLPELPRIPPPAETDRWSDVDTSDDEGAPGDAAPPGVAAAASAGGEPAALPSGDGSEPAAVGGG